MTAGSFPPDSTFQAIIRTLPAIVVDDDEVVVGSAWAVALSVELNPVASATSPVAPGEAVARMKACLVDDDSVWDDSEVQPILKKPNRTINTRKIECMKGAFLQWGCKRNARGDSVLDSRFTHSVRLASKGGGTELIRYAYSIRRGCNCKRRDLESTTSELGFR